jgi:hypothetical protein
MDKFEKVFTSEYRCPHFLGIGVPKAGTTWLDFVLRQHPDIWMPNVKELHFFDEYFQHIREGNESRFFSSDTYIRNRWRRYLRTELKRCLRFPSKANLAWTFRFLFSRRDFNYFRRLFPENPIHCCGEITPAYCTLTESQIELIHQYFPNLKIILLLRNPIDRAWSHARMELLFRKKKDIQSLSPSVLEEFLFRDRGVQMRNNYPEIIRRWSRVFGRDKIFIGIYDDIKVNPEALLQEIFHFLKVKKIRLSPDVTGKVVFQGVESPLDPAIRHRLIMRYTQDIHKIAADLQRPDLIDAWLC